MSLPHRLMLAFFAGNALGTGAATAQDLGALEKRIDALEKSADRQSVNRTKKTMSLTVSGHINRAIQFRDNGTTSGVLHVTDNLSRSRVRWIGEGRISDDLSVETRIELGNQSSISSQQDLADNADDNAGGAALDERFFEFIVTSKTLGKLYVGQGSTASDDTSEVDLSGTGVATLNGDVASLAGSEAFQLAGAAQGRTVANVFSNFDGAGRRDRIRYDTPKFAGVFLAVSHQNADSWDVGLHYGATIGSVKVAAGLGYADDTTRNFNKTVSGSASVLLPIGLSFTVGAAKQDSNRASGGQDSDWRYAKIGYGFKGLDLGETRFAVDYSIVDDLAATGERAYYYGAALVQLVDVIGAELYFSYHNLNLEVSGAADPEDIDVVTAGARVKF